MDAYMRMLKGVADRADAIEPRVIASHWPFVGSDYRQLLVVSRAERRDQRQANGQPRMQRSAGIFPDGHLVVQQLYLPVGTPR